MGGNQTKSVKNVIEDSAITATSEVLLKNAEHQKNVDNIDLTAKGNIEIGSIDVAQNASYSIKSVNLNGMNNNFMNSMSSNLATLLKQSSGTLANQNTDVISDQIKSTFNATVSMKNVVDNINTTINKANIDLKADGNIKVGSITMNASITIVKSEVRSQIQSSDFANKLMAELKIEATQSQKGVFAVLSVSRSCCESEGVGPWVIKTVSSNCSSITRLLSGAVRQGDAYIKPVECLAGQQHEQQNSFEHASHDLWHRQRDLC